MLLLPLNKRPLIWTKLLGEKVVLFEEDYDSLKMNYFYMVHVHDVNMFPLTYSTGFQWEGIFLDALKVGQSLKVILT